MLLHYIFSNDFKYNHNCIGVFGESQCERFLCYLQIWHLQSYPEYDKIVSSFVTAMTNRIKQDIRAVSTIVAGTIGVGFFAIPYAIHTFGTFWGVGVLIFVGILTLIINFVYSDIITADRGNHQVPGYARKYLGKYAAIFTSIVTILGLLGVLLAYSLLAGNALQLIFRTLGVNIRTVSYAIIFGLISLVITRFGVKPISKISSFVVGVLLIMMLLIVVIALPQVSLENATAIDFSHFSLIFGVSIFSLYSAASIPVIDEIIGYEPKRYKRVVLIASVVTLIAYILFGVATSLSFGDLLSSDFIVCFCDRYASLVLLVAVFTLLAVFSSFVLIANTMMEILSYDYKMPKKTAIVLIAGVLIWLILLEIGDFESVISTVGNVALAIQSMVVFAIWYKMRMRSTMLMKVLVAVSAVVLIGGMLMQL